MQLLSLKWDQLSRLPPQRWLPPTRTHQQLTEVHPQRWSLTRRQPLCPRRLLVSSHLHYLWQPHAQWGDQGELIVRGHTNIRGCSGTLHTTTNLASHNNSTLILFFFSSSMMNDVACFQLLNGGFIILFINYPDYLISNLTDLSASNDVSMIFQGYIEEWNSKFPHS